MKLTSWDSSFNGDTNAILFAASDALLNEAAFPPSLSHFISYVANRNVSDIVAYSIDYANVDVSACIVIRQIQAFFSKRSDLGDEASKRLTAVNKFWETETKCRETNHVFKAMRSGKILPLPRVSSILFRASRIISHVLGDVPNLSDLKLSFGPGATVNTKKAVACSRVKLSAPLQCSESFVPMLGRMVDEMPGWFETADHAPVQIEITHGKVSFVPKDAKTHRVISTEPSLNVLAQKGIGSYIAQRLRTHARIDIRDQTRNQNLARIGSIDGSLATIDLSSASDTISTELVYELLPVEWALYLDTLRSGTVTLDGTVIRLEKFSTAGNGFTFPLETLIFYAISKACCGNNAVISVYGDDIIIPSCDYRDVAYGLTICGFTINDKKSFHSGPFRESCGADYCSGINVRPVYQKQALTMLDVFRLRNYFYRNFDKVMSDFFEDLIEPTSKIFGPDGYGDGHLISDAPLSVYNRDLGWAGYIFETYTAVPNRIFRNRLHGDHVLPCYTVYARDLIDFPTPERATFKGAKGRRLDLSKPVNIEPFSIRYDKRREGFSVVVPGFSTYVRTRVYTLQP